MKKKLLKKLACFFAVGAFVMGLLASCENTECTLNKAVSNTTNPAALYAPTCWKVESPNGHVSYQYKNAIDMKSWQQSMEELGDEYYIYLADEADCK